MTTNHTALKLLALSFTLATVPIYAENLDDLLNDGSNPKALTESSKFQTGWNTMLDELSKREYLKADSALKILEAERGFVPPYAAILSGLLAGWCASRNLWKETRRYSVQISKR
jgi:hypothetical protein